MSKNGNLVIDEIHEELRLIQGTEVYYVTPTGNVYKYDTKHDKYLHIKSHQNNHNDYLYVGIRYAGEKTNVTRRLHILVARAYIENPDNYPYVGHKDNIKTHDTVDNLYWTTPKENTQKAVDDGLMVNDIGITDNQSFPVACYTNAGKLVGVYGSISEAGRLIKGTTKSSIAKVINTSSRGTKGYIYKQVSKEFYFSNKNLAGVAIETEPIVKRRRQFNLYLNGTLVDTSDNQKQTGKKWGIPQSTLSSFVTGKRVKPFNGFVAKLVPHEKL